MQPAPRSPRHYAAELDRLSGKALLKALDQVPAEWRDLVKEHIRSVRALRKARRAQPKE